MVYYCLLFNWKIGSRRDRWTMRHKLTFHFSILTMYEWPVCCSLGYSRAQLHHQLWGTLSELISTLGLVLQRDWSLSFLLAFNLIISGTTVVWACGLTHEFLSFCLKQIPCWLLNVHSCARYRACYWLKICPRLWGLWTRSQKLHFLGGVINLTSGMSCKLNRYDQFQKLTFYPQTQMHNKALNGEAWFAPKDPTHKVESKICLQYLHP